MTTFFDKLVRKKVLQKKEIDRTDLNRCLTTLDLTLLGIGSTLGAGLYVLVGQVALDKAGPSLTISFLVAAIASIMSGLCYAEFAARIPRAGSAYVYSYVTVGELMAFVIGWNLILEYVIGTASVARAWSSYFDHMIDKRMSCFFKENTPMYIAQFSDYPDFFAFGITMLLTILLIVGVKESARVNNVFTGVNLLVVLYIAVCGFFKIDWSNWSIPKNEVPDGKGDGGFLPYGFSGTIAGAATCFYAYVGFDCVATTGEETGNPQRSTPIAIVVSLLVVFLAYFITSAVVTLMCPYFELDPDAALPAVFDRVGWGFARNFISIGALCALSTSMLGGMFPLPRILYAMANDGVIFRFLGKVHPHFKTPVIGTALSGLFAGTMAMIFDLDQLVDMMSIGTLLAYTLVALSVLILRYETDEELRHSVATTRSQLQETNVSGCGNFGENTSLIDRTTVFKLQHLFAPEVREPTSLTSRITKMSIAVLNVFITAFCLVSIKAADALSQKQVWAITAEIVLGLGMLLCSFIIFQQPQNPTKLHFKVPFLPWLPILSSVINVYLMLKLSSLTWVRFGVWMTIGFLIYFIYGIRNAQTGVHKRPLPSISESDGSTDIQSVPPSQHDSVENL